MADILEATTVGLYPVLYVDVLEKFIALTPVPFVGKVRLPEIWYIPVLGNVKTPETGAETPIAINGVSQFVYRVFELSGIDCVPLDDKIRISCVADENPFDKILPVNTLLV